MRNCIIFKYSFEGYMIKNFKESCPLLPRIDFSCPTQADGIKSL